MKRTKTISYFWHVVMP